MYGSDFEALWEDVPQNILPVEYGGEGLSIAALTGELVYLPMLLLNNLLHS